MMNLEKTLQSMWDFYPLLGTKLPKERVTTGPPGKGVLPYVTIEIDHLVPDLLTNKGYLRERVSFRLHLRHDDYVEGWWIADYLDSIFSTKMIFDFEYMLRAQVYLKKTTIRKLEDRTWRFTLDCVVDANLHSDPIPAI